MNLVKYIKENIVEYDEYYGITIGYDEADLHAIIGLAKKELKEIEKEDKSEILEIMKK